MLRIHAGDREIGYLYNFAADGWVMAYQAGLTPPPDNRWKPGLVCHAAAIAFCLERGDRIYDFLAGPARYKSSLPIARFDGIAGGVCAEMAFAVRGCGTSP